MLEELSISRYLWEKVYVCTLIIMSNNPLSAANQQERLIKIGWVIGFVDGEGCFSIGFVRQGDRPNRKGYKTGYQVNHKFCVTQGQRASRVSQKFRNFLASDRSTRTGVMIITKKIFIIIMFNAKKTYSMSLFLSFAGITCTPQNSRTLKNLLRALS